MKLSNQVYLKLESKGYPKFTDQPPEPMSVQDALRHIVVWLSDATMNRKVVIQLATSPEHFDDKRQIAGTSQNVDDIMSELLEGILLEESSES